MLVGMYTSTWVQKGSAATLTTIQLAGVAPEVNLRNSLCAGEKHTNKGSTMQMSPVQKMGTIK